MILKNALIHGGVECEVASPRDTTNTQPLLLAIYRQKSVANMTRQETSPGSNDPLAFISLTSVSIPDHAVVIADQALPKDLLDTFQDPIFVEAGEGLKTLESIGTLAQRVLERRSSKPMILIAVGGGSVGDAVGFLASILWRGVELWHVPSTLLAMVDSAHGGKTAVNLDSHKNQLGTFYPATRVLIANEFLNTLPIPQREQGLAELLKTLWLGDAAALDLWDTIGSDALAADPYIEITSELNELLARAVSVKKEIVVRDPRETREIRTFLNLGHTVAHALELHMGLSHGHAVAWGLACVAVISLQHADLDPTDADRLFRQVYPLLEPIHRSEIPSFEKFEKALLKDKKRRDGALRSVVLDAPGSPRVCTIVPMDWYDAFMKAVDLWERCPIALSRPQPRAANLVVEASKSELNRLLVMQALSPIPLSVTGESRAADVQRLKRALREMRQGEQRIDVGEGGTTTDDWSIQV